MTCATLLAVALTATAQPTSASERALLSKDALAALIRATSPEALTDLGQQALRELGPYQVRLTKQERIGKSLQERQVIELSVREDPFAVQLHYVEGPSAGRRGFYDARARPGDMRVRDSGLFGILGAMWIGIHNSLAFRDTNHAVTEVGFGSVLRQLADNRKRAAAFGGFARTDEGFNERGRWCIRFTAPPAAQGLYAKESRTCYDPVSYLPLEMSNWDNQGLLEVYVFSDPKPHTGAGPAAFTVKEAGL